MAIEVDWDEAAMWHPELTDGAMPIYERLVLAMAQDIEGGRLAPGVRLPTQRDLAFRLGVSVGSVTWAYAEAERRGLLTARVGRGSFVREKPGPVPDSHGVARGAVVWREHDGPIDLRCNTPPPVPLMGELNAALSGLMLHGALDPAVQYIQGSGLPQVRRAGAEWISRQFGLKVAAEDLIQCNGGQHAIALVLSSLCRHGDTVLCESSTFYGARIAADHLGLKLRGVEMDEEGIRPDALRRAISETGSRLLFTLPTLHNPTTRTMSDARRQEVAAIARSGNLMILEDDAYYAYSDRPTQIVSYAPERTLYLASLSKAVCPGFRLAFLALPPALSRDRLMRGVRALGYCPPALGGLVFTQWVEDGRIDAIAQAVQVEAAVRWDMAQSKLGKSLAQPGAAHSPHAWLPLGALDAERAAAQLLRAGVEVMPPDASAVSAEADSGLRLCLGAPGSREELKHALTIIADVVARKGDHDRDGLI